MENNKKALILSVLGVLVLIIAVVGVSFAMYTFSATGTKENVITTGSVSLNYDDTAAAGGNGVLTLDNQYPMADSLGIAQTGNNVLTFEVNATINGTMTINYEIGLDSIVEGDTLKQEYIKLVLYKDGVDAPIIGTATEGVTVASLQEKAGTLISNYKLTDGTFTSTGKQRYVLKAWVSDQYKFTVNKTDTDTEANEHVQTGTTTQETFKFKVKVAASQAV